MTSDKIFKIKIFDDVLICPFCNSVGRLLENIRGTRGLKGKMEEFYYCTYCHKRIEKDKIIKKAIPTIYKKNEKEIKDLYENTLNKIIEEKRFEEDYPETSKLLKELGEFIRKLKAENYLLQQSHNDLIKKNKDLNKRNQSLVELIDKELSEFANKNKELLIDVFLKGDNIG